MALISPFYDFHFLPLYSVLLISYLAPRPRSTQILPAQSDTCPFQPSAGTDSDSDDSPRLVSVLVGNVHLAFRERGRARSAGGRRAWDRVIVALLVALSGWMWDSPAGVRDFFGEGGGLQVVRLDQN